MAETLHRHAAARTVDTPLPAEAALAPAGRAVAALARLVAHHPAGWRWLARRHHPVLDRLAAANARSTCVRAARRVPAYQAFLRARPGGLRRRLRDFPETDKRGYVMAYDASARCRDGRMPGGAWWSTSRPARPGGRSTGRAASGSCGRCTATSPGTPAWRSRCAARSS
ncbi:hypothetical protein V2I01_42235 [Micromonospora sp. BRA006-A]|nr:hypothetical protein [Micromonospora sp. BRA006-A]